MSQIPDLVATLLLSQRLHHLPVKPLNLHYPVPVMFESLGEYCRKTDTASTILAAELLSDAVTISASTAKGAAYIVLYNETVPHPGRRAFTLAHEIGHILLGHTDDDDAHEHEADAFAAELLMPRILVDQLCRDHNGGSELLRQVFGVSKQSADGRIRGFQRELYSGAELHLLECYRPLLPKKGEPEINF